MRILLVEDDHRIATPLAEDLSHQRHVVDLAKDGLEGWEATQWVTYDLILLDLMLPKLDGLSLCKRLRAAQSQALILMLTGKGLKSNLEAKTSQFAGWFNQSRAGSSRLKTDVESV